MKVAKLKYGLGGIVIGVLLVLITAMPIVNSNNAKTMELDAHFIEQMIPHHEDAITMAQLAREKGQKPEIKELAETIIVSQGAEINQMKEWYRDWFGKEVPQDSRVMGGHGMGQSTSIHMGMMGDETDMTRLEQVEDFDSAFVEHMIPHHQMAVMMATMLKNGTQRPEMQKLAEDIEAAQTDEIEQMRQWYIDWGNFQ